MFRNYILVTARSFLRQKYYSIINTLGLALGLAACLLILLFVQDELSYESGFANHEQIYRLTQDFPMGNHLSQSATVPFPTKNAMLEDFPEISKAGLIFRPSSWGNIPLIRYEEDQYYEDDFIFAEHSFLEIYNFVFIKGDLSRALKGPNELLVTEGIAKKYFGDDDPIGKRLNLNGFRDLEVVGVIEPIPENTHLHFDMIASFETFRSFINNPQFFDTQWIWVAAWMYFSVENESDAERIIDQLPEFVKRHYPASLVEKGVSLHVQRADDIHLTSNLELEFKSNGNIQHVYLFSAIAILTLFIAIINFVNLSTSRAVKRAKEVGLRKVMGADRRMLITQFIGEALLTSTLALIIALVLINIVSPWFNDLTGKNITASLWGNTGLLVGAFSLIVMVGILSGSYPALVLSSFNPTDVLKGRVTGTSSSSFFRKALVIVQFVVSISLIICIGVVYRQLHYIHNKDLGFNKEQILLADMNFNLFNRYSTFKSELSRLPEVRAITLLGGSIPGQEEVIENAYVESGTPPENQQWFSTSFASHDIEHVLNIQFIDGHGFQVGSAVDSTGFIINQSTAKALGWEDDVVGRSLDRLNTNDGTTIQTGTVIGLVKDFHYRPLYEPIKPLVISMGGGKVGIKLQSDDLAATLSLIRKEWDKQFENTPFRYSFMDTDFDHLYEKEYKFSKTIQYFSILAIFIACLGLLGLSSHATENRRKEIGIRKVNGASTFRLVRLFAKEFTQLILIAYLISIPIAWHFSNLWLNNFSYRTPIEPSIFISAGLIALLIAMLTISYHTIKSAMTDPVKSLRYE